MLVQLIYLSTSAHPLTDQELESILESSRQNNNTLDVTGLLLVKGRSFLQVLEGELSAVHQLYDKITLDSRHENVIKIQERQMDHRDFAEWRMGFKNLDRLPKVETDKLFDATQVDITSDDFVKSDSQLLKIIQYFIDKD